MLPTAYSYKLLNMSVTFNYISSVSLSQNIETKLLMGQTVRNLERTVFNVSYPLRPARLPMLCFSELWDGVLMPGNDSDRFLAHR